MATYQVIEQRVEIEGGIDLAGAQTVGAGGFAALWKAGQYAIKSFFSKESEATAQSEYAYLARLNEAGCPNVPTAYSRGVFEDARGEHPAFVMDYIEGQTLAEVMAKGKLTGHALHRYASPEQAVAIALHIAQAIAQISQVGSVHRDLSPKNIILTDRCVGEGLQTGVELYLVDFGQSTWTNRMTVTYDFRARLGTIPFSAPEIFPGSKYYEKRNTGGADIWSLGALIAYMLVGEQWLEEIVSLPKKRREGGVDSDDLALILQAKGSPIDLESRLEATGRSVGDAERVLANIVRACTNYNPSFRPPLGAVIEDLQDCLDDLLGTGFPAVTPEIKRSSYIDGDGGTNVSAGPVWEETDPSPEGVDIHLDLGVTPSTEEAESLEVASSGPVAGEYDAKVSVGLAELSEESLQEDSDPFDGVGRTVKNDSERAQNVDDDRLKDESIVDGDRPGDSRKPPLLEGVGESSAAPPFDVVSKLDNVDDGFAAIQGTESGVDYWLETRPVDWLEPGAFQYKEYGSVLHFKNNREDVVLVTVAIRSDDGVKKSSCRKLGPGAKGFVAFKERALAIAQLNIQPMRGLSPADRFAWDLARHYRLVVHNLTDQRAKAFNVVAMGEVERYVHAGRLVVSEKSVPETMDRYGTASFDIGGTLGDLGHEGLTVYVDGVEIPSVWSEPGLEIEGDHLVGYEGNVPTVVVPEGVRWIASETFAHKDNIHCVSLPSTVEMLNARVFYWCDNLQIVSIHSTIHSINEDAFMRCRSLTTVIIDGKEKELHAASEYRAREIVGLIPGTELSGAEGAAFIFDDNPYDAGGTLLSFGTQAYIPPYNPDVTVKIPAGTRRVSSRVVAEGSKYSIGGIRIPDTVEHIDELAFEGCERLTSVELPTTHITIARSAFAGCPLVSEIKVGSDRFVISPHSNSANPFLFIVRDKNLSNLTLNGSRGEHDKNVNETSLAKSFLDEYRRRSKGTKGNDVENSQLMLLVRATALGNGEATRLLALRLYEGHVSEEDRDFALPVLRRASRSKSEGSQLNLAISLLLDGDEKRQEKGYRLLREMVEANDALAEKVMADCLYYGRGGLRKDVGRALALYERSARHGCAQAQLSLGLLCAQGPDSVRAPWRAVRYLERCVSQGMSEASLALARLYEDGYGVRKNPTKAAELYAAAYDAMAEVGDAEARIKAALVRLYNGRDQEVCREGISQLERMIREYQSSICLDARFEYYAYLLVAGETTKAAKALNELVEGDRDGTYLGELSLGERMLDKGSWFEQGMPGTGTSCDASNVKKWAATLYREATACGSQEAAERLKRRGFRQFR